MISQDDGATFTYEVHPSGVPNPLFNWTKDSGNTRASKRKEVAGEFTFSKGHDYDYFLALKGTAGQCGPVYMRIDVLCGTWQTVWTGRFPAGGGKWNYTACTFVIKPEPDDRYSCIDERQNVKSNLLLQGYHTVTASTVPTVRFGASVYNTYGSPPGYRTYNVILDSSGNAEPYWALHGYEYYDPNGPYNYRLWWYEEFVTDCIDGVAQVPSGTGWILIHDGCSDTVGLYVGKAVYGRQPQFSYPISGLYAGSCGPGDTGIPPSPSACVGGFFIEAWPCNFMFESIPGMLRPPLYVCYRGISTTLTRARTLSDCLSQILLTSDCDIVGVRSDFFGINPVGDAPGYVSGENYVTGGPTQTESIMVLQNSDVINPSATSHAVIGEMSFKEMMVALSVMFKVLWAIDHDGYLRIEHFIYWNNPNGLDLTLVPSRKLVEPQIHESLNESVPNAEEATFQASQLADFVGKRILYSGPCVTSKTSGDVVGYSPGAITTDIAMILADSTSLDVKGFVFLACEPNGSDYSTIIDIGAISGVLTTNAPLSWANLMRDFWTWDRYLPTGNMNGSDATFDGFRENMKQTGVKVVCFDCDLLSFDADAQVKSTLGDGHLGGTLATITKASMGTSGNLELDLAYSL